MSENQGLRITPAVFSWLTASLRADALRGFNRGDVPPTTYKAMVEEIDALEVQRRRGRMPEDPELLREWTGRRHASLPETREKRAAIAMLNRLVALVSAYAAGYEDGAREARGEKKPTPLTNELAAAEQAS